MFLSVSRTATRCTATLPRLFSALFSTLLMCSLGQSLQAATVTLNAISSGWYTSAGIHSATNDNYVVGKCCGNVQYRNFFVFDLSSVNDPILSASLDIYNPSATKDLGNGYFSPAPSRTYTLYSVATPVATLTAGGSGLVSIFNDLGSGTVYGSQSVSTADNGTVVSVSLDGAAILDLESSHGLFALGGTLSPLDPAAPTDEFAAFSGQISSASNLTRELVLVTTPEPASIGLYAVSLAVGFAYCCRIRIRMP